MKNKKTGFTIVELLVVIVIIGILAAITIISYVGIQNKATIASLVSDLDNTAKILKLDQISNSTYPVDLSAANGGKGIPNNDNTTYSYVVSSTNPQTFCITATKNSISYNISPDNVPLAGPCPILRLDASNASSYSGTGNTWFDLSGNTNNATLFGGTSYINDKVGTLSFDGTSSYVRTTIMPASSSFTISIWFKTTNARDGDRLYWGNGSNRAILANSGTSGKLQWYVQTATLSVGYNVTNSAYNLGSWNNVVLEYTGSQVQCYINGVQDIISANLTGTSNSSAFNLGTNYNSTGNWYNGLISEFKFYDKPLSSDEITQNFTTLRSRYGV